MSIQQEPSLTGAGRNRRALTSEAEVVAGHPSLPAPHKGPLPACASFPPARFEQIPPQRLVSNKCPERNRSFKWSFSGRFMREQPRVAELSRPCPPRRSLRKFNPPSKRQNHSCLPRIPSLAGDTELPPAVGSHLPGLTDAAGRTRGPWDGRLPRSFGSVPSSCSSQSPETV